MTSISSALRTKDSTTSYSLIAVEACLMGLDRCNKLVGLVRFDDCYLKAASLMPHRRQSIEEIKHLLPHLDNLFHLMQALNYLINLM